MNNPLTQLDRLVDGELAPSARRELLAWLDANPQHWRDCSLAFLEAQSWRGALGSEAKPPMPAQVVRPKTSPTSTPGMWFALAAAVLVAFVAGQQLPLIDSATPDPSMVAGAQPAQKSGAGPKGDVLTLWAVDDQGQRQSIRVPLVDAEWLDPQLQSQLGSQFSSTVNDSARRQLRNRGYDVESRQRFAPLVMDDGRPLLLPVEDTRVVPVVNTVY